MKDWKKRLLVLEAAFWSVLPDILAAAGAVKLRVWLTFYAVRGSVQNTACLERHLTDLIKQLQYAGGDESDAEHENTVDPGGGDRGQ